MKAELQKELEKKFITSERFCQEIEQIALKETKPRRIRRLKPKKEEK